jgi:hypothetical protein
MKKTLVTCLVVVALFAIASSASAIICTIDQRPAATLLVPYFQAAFNSDGTPTTGAASLDTYVTIANASSAPMIAHVSVYNERSFLVLDFNIALTGFDVQAMSMAGVLSGSLPVTPISKTHVSPIITTLANDPCLRNSAALPAVGTSRTDSFMRVRPPGCVYNVSGQNPACVNTADPNDPTLATTLYSSPAWPYSTAAGSFYVNVLGSLDTAAGSLGCTTPASFPLAGTVRGYIVIDHANYCTISDPSATSYYNNDAIGNENNLFGEVIFTSGSGTPTFGVSTVNIESSRVFSTVGAWGNGVGGGGYFTQTNAVRERTFYARYWTPTGLTRPNANTVAFATAGAAPVSGPTPWNQGFGDEREPTGLKFATRYFEATSGAVTSYFRVWRASAGLLTNLTGTLAAGGVGGACTAIEPSIFLTFFDEDENTVTQAGTQPCPSPCSVPPPSPLNFPLETQRTRANSFTLPAAFGGANVGWMSASFVNTGSAIANFGGLLDQAWMDYEFTGAAAFYNASIPGTQLDPSTCHPLLIPLTDAGGTIVVPDALTDPVTPGGAAGTSTNPATGTGP